MRKRERRFQGYPSRWGEAVVHRYLYSYENRMWYVACRGPGKDPHGREVDAEVTCKRCLKR